MHQFCWPLVTAELKNGSAHLMTNLSLCSAESDTQAAIHYTLDHRYNAPRYNTDSVTARLKSWIPIFWDWPKLDIDSTVSVNRTHAIPMPTKWAGVFSASPLHPAIDLILMYTMTHAKHGKPYTVLKSDTPNWEDTRRDAHMTLNSQQSLASIMTTLQPQPHRPRHCCISHCWQLSSHSTDCCRDCSTFTAGNSVVLNYANWLC